MPFPLLYAVTLWMLVTEWLLVNDHGHTDHLPRARPQEPSSNTHAQEHTRPHTGSEGPAILWGGAAQLVSLSRPTAVGQLLL